MAIILKDIHDLVRDSLARGKQMDHIIPIYVEQAAHWLERNMTLPYMRRFGTFQIIAEAESPRVIKLPCNAVKSIDLIRVVLDNGTYVNLNRVDPYEMVALEIGGPSAYWMDKDLYIILNRVPDRDYACEIQWTELSDWRKDDDEFSHWLINYGVDALIAKALMLFGPRLRDDRIVAAYNEQLQTGLKTLALFKEEQEFSDRTEHLKFDWRA